MIEFEPTPKTGDAKTMLRSFLQQNRAIVVWKARGLTDDQARMTPFESATSVIGLLQHLAIVETSWFHEIFADSEVDYRFDFDVDVDAEWHLRGDERLADALAWYEEAVDTSNSIIDAAELDDLSGQSRRGDRFSLRWVITHMIEETARHAGHLDVLRESIDGSLGYLPD